MATPAEPWAAPAGGPTPPPGTPTPTGTPQGPTGGGFGGDEAPTAMLAPVPAGPPAQDPVTPAFGIPVSAPVPPAEQTVQLRAVPLPRPGGGPAERQPRSRRLPLLAAAGAAVAVGAVALALVTFTGSDERDTALVDPKPSSPVTESAPAAPSEAPSGPTASSSASASPSPTASASRSASASPSPSASRSASPSPSASAGTTRAPSPTAPAKPVQPATLRRGDSGPEVEKLQRLLSERGMYRGRVDGRYGRSVEGAVASFQMEHDVYDDEFGVYGPATRRALEG
ncbi:peptidoglycan-binding protein [Streptomyces sp. WAC07149]|uniref:peptidoglycan-binding domain-containing protein n=1 Tax=Streptomyces sp. WAC07149 TaxID=2487425 RepID=UPI000F768C5D|nr:peptidoglycan-binding domain-containing protein [Streptomyces sp. WAC07149]RST03408.1 peptidoglycan-binding protein [Streptomyces sp. WAC07149]